MMEHQRFYQLLALLFSSLLALGLSSGLFIARADFNSAIDNNPPGEEIQKIKDLILPEIQSFSILAIGGAGGILVVKAFTGK